MSQPALTVLPRKRRGVEALLIAFALVITLSAYALVDINVTGSISPMFGYLAGGGVLLAALAHIAVRWRLPYADPILLPCVVLLNGLGLAMIHRIDLISEPVAHGARQQLIWTTIGVIMFIAVAVVIRDHRPLQRFTYTLGLAGIVLLLLPLVPGHRDRQVRCADLDPRRAVQLPARRGGQGPAGHRLRGVPGGEARGAGPGRLPDPRSRPAAGP